MNQTRTSTQSVSAGDHVKGLLATAANVVEYVRFGGLDTGEEPSPYKVVARDSNYRLRRYFASPTMPPAEGAPILLVPPLLMTADVWDVSPRTSAVAHLHRQGLDPWVIDFGDPGTEPGGNKRNVTDHVLALSRAIDQIRDATGKDIHIGGYSQGGLFCYQAAAYRGCESIVSIFALGSPMEPLAFGGLGIPEDVLSTLSQVGTKILSHTGLPGWAAAGLFRWTSPVASIRGQVDYLLALRNRDALLPRERQRRFLSGDGWITFPGPAIAEVMETMTNERFVRGGLVFGERAVSLADITCPILIFTGTLDAFAPPRAVRDVAKAAPLAPVWECSLPTGHFGLGVGSRANRSTWPTVGAWIDWVAGAGDRPDSLVRVEFDGSAKESATATPSSDGLAWSAVRVAANTAVALPGVLSDTATHAFSALNDLAHEAIEQVPRIARLERISATSQVSYGKLLDEAYERNPDGVALLYGERAYTHGEVKKQIDDVVGQLLSVGLRRGEHIGVLMDSGVTILTAVAAISRIGAVAVLMRPGGDIEAEARLGRISRLLVDHQHALQRPAIEQQVLHLGSRRDDLADGIIDLADVHDLRAPEWFRPNPSRGRDLAFVLFSDVGGQLRATPITNRRWALSAHGAASAASLTAADTVYSASPLHHASGLLLATAAPVAVGARLALASRFEPESFWSDVRRYGATVVPYTWAMLQGLLNAPEQPEERHHPIRLFIGSGMPRSVWSRVLDRFEPAAVVEIFAVARTNAILANVSGRKIGAAGKPLPGTAGVAVAVIDPLTHELRYDAHGYAQIAPPGVPGILLVEADRDLPLWEDVPLRGVFGPRDAWLASGEWFARDNDGDLWPLGRIVDDIRTETGIVRPRQVEDALGDIDEVDLAVCLRTHDGAGHARATAVVSLRPGAELDNEELDHAVAQLLPAARPDEVRVLPEIPTNKWYRPSLRHLKELLAADDSGPMWHKDASGGMQPVHTASARVRSAQT